MYLSGRPNTHSTRVKSSPVHRKRTTSDYTNACRGNRESAYTWDTHIHERRIGAPAGVRRGEEGREGREEDPWKRERNTRHTQFSRNIWIGPARRRFNSAAGRLAVISKTFINYKWKLLRCTTITTTIATATTTTIIMTTATITIITITTCYHYYYYYYYI